MPDHNIEDSVMAVFGFSEDLAEESWPILAVYGAFHSLKEKYPDLFSMLHFSERGGHHYSKDLEQLFFSMGTAKLLEVRNPEYGCYSIKADSKKSIQEYLKNNLGEANCKIVKEAANVFRDLLKEAHDINSEYCAV